jgi:hypothetical protein
MKLLRDRDEIAKLPQLDRRLLGEILTRKPPRRQLGLPRLDDTPHHLSDRLPLAGTLDGQLSGSRDRVTGACTGNDHVLRR